MKNNWLLFILIPMILAIGLSVDGGITGKSITTADNWNRWDVSDVEVQTFTFTTSASSEIVYASSDRIDGQLLYVETTFIASKVNAPTSVLLAVENWRNHSLIGGTRDVVNQLIAGATEIPFVSGPINIRLQAIHNTSGASGTIDVYTKKAAR